MKANEAESGKLPKWAICGVDPKTGYIGFLKTFDVKDGEATNFNIPLWETKEEAQAYYDAHNVEGVFYDGYKVRHIDDVTEEVIAKKHGKGFRRAIWALVIALVVSASVDLAALLFNLGLFP